MPSLSLALLEAASVDRLLQVDPLSAPIGCFFPSLADGGQGDEASTVPLPTMTGTPLAGRIPSSAGSKVSSPTILIPPFNSCLVHGGSGVLEEGTQGGIAAAIGVVFRDCLGSLVLPWVIAYHISFFPSERADYADTWGRTTSTLLCG